MYTSGDLISTSVTNRLGIVMTEGRITLNIHHLYTAASVDDLPCFLFYFCNPFSNVTFLVYSFYNNDWC